MKSNKYLVKEYEKFLDNRKDKKVFSNYTYKGYNIDEIRENMKVESIDIKSNVKISTMYIYGIRVLKYTVNDAKNSLVYIHGGAFVGSRIEDVENACKLFSSILNVTVYSIDYNRAPEVQYPDNVKELNKVLDFLYDKSIFYLSGDSAGANLALLLVQTSKIKFEKLVLYYPLVDLSQSVSVNLDSYRGFSEDEKVRKTVLQLESCERLCKDIYLKNESDIYDPKVSPIYMDTSILPKTLIFLCEYDYLLFQEKEFIKKIKDCKVILYKGIGHGFLNLVGIVNEAYESILEVKKFI